MDIPEAKYFEQAVELSDAGEYEDALDAFNKAIEANPGHIEAFNRRGDVYVELGDYELALADYSQAIQLDPTYTLAYYNRGTLYLAHHEAEKALADYSQGIELDPKDADFYYNRALAYIELKRFDEAIADLNQSIELGQPDADMYFQHGIACFSKLDLQGALADFTRALELGKRDETIYRYRSAVYNALDDRVNALSDLEQMLVLQGPGKEALRAQVAARLERIRPIVLTPEQMGEWKRLRQRAHWLEFLAFVASFVVWRLSETVRGWYVLQLPVTFVHEAGHGLSAILTGGRFVRFQVYANGAGIAFTAGGIRFIILQAGYLGAALFGAILLVLANRVKPVRNVSLFIAFFFAGCTALFMDSTKPWAFPVFLLFGTIVMAAGALGNLRVIRSLVNSLRDRQRARMAFITYGLLSLVLLMGVISLLAKDPLLLRQIMADPTMMVGLTVAGGFLVLALLASEPVNIFALNVLAFSTGFNAVNDIWFLAQNPGASGPGFTNDAAALASLTGTTSGPWIAIWIILVFLMMGAAILIGLLIPPGALSNRKVEVKGQTQ